MATSIVSQQGLRIAVEGCGHGTLHAIYASVQKACEIKGWEGVDLLIIGGDFQSVRNAQDLNTISMPAKYREIGDFHEYYSGARTAPYLTVFVGGNHEASNYLWELYYGGWVAPNIYYMGAANVVRLGPLRIAGLSGIWKGYNFKKPHYERMPYNSDDIKSIYHVREWDTRKLLQLRTQVDVGISHDWPRAIEWSGDWKTLFRKKSHFEQESRDGTLGSVAAKLVLDRLRPAYWFSAHMHVKFSALLQHQDQVLESTKESQPEANGHATAVPAAKNEEEIGLDIDDDGVFKAPQAPPKNDAEIDLDLYDDETPSRQPAMAIGDAAGQDGTPKQASQDLRDLLPESFARPVEQPKTKLETLPFPKDITNKGTRFLALDKCLPHRDFLQLLEVDSLSAQPFDRPLRLEYDKEWLAITRVFAPGLQVGDPDAQVPPDRGDAFYQPLIEKEEEWVEENIVQKGPMTIPEDFQITAPPYDTTMGQFVEDQPREYNNAHTQGFCELLQIPNPFQASEEERVKRFQAGPRPDSERGRGNHGRGGRGFGRGGSRGGRGRGGRGGRGGNNANFGRGRGSRW